MVKHDGSCAHDIACLAFSQEPVHQKQEEANGKNKTVEIRMDSFSPPQFSFIDLLLDYEKNTNGKNVVKKA